MPVEVKLPQLGESTYEGTIGKWLKQPGDRVERFEPLVEIVTDKVNVEMPSPFTGVLKEILVPEGETKTVGTPIAIMETDGAAAETVAPAPVTDGVKADAAVRDGGGHRDMEPGTLVTGEVQRAQGSMPEPTRGPEGRREGREGARLSPLVRKLAEEHAIPLAEIEALAGTGANGRVTKDDLMKYIETRPAGGPGAPGRDGAPAATPVAPTTRPAAAPTAGPEDHLLKLTPLRRTIAQRMAQSKREIPHAYGVIEVDMTEALRWREAHKEEWQRRHATNVTYTAFFVRAAAGALRAFPVVNAAWTDEGVLQRGRVHIGIGVSIEDGLTVPVIKDADQKSLAGIARDLEDLGRRAREGKLGLEDVQGGTFTITNPGVFGSIWSMPVILPGQAAILATDAIVKRAVVRNDAIAIRAMMHLGLSFDHRVFDGAVAVQFLNHIKARLEAIRADGPVSDF